LGSPPEEMTNIRNDIRKPGKQEMPQSSHFCDDRTYGAHPGSDAWKGGRGNREDKRRKLARGRSD
jgi:hypothetical protein